MANQNKELQLSEENFDFDELEKALEQELDAKTLDLELATKDREKIGNPESLAETVGNVVWEQFINQIGRGAGEEFIKQNKGLELDLSNDAHIQTTEKFAKGIFPSHNKEIYEKRYKDWQANFQEDENHNIKMHSTRMGIEEATLAKGARKPFDKDRPKGSSERKTQMDHTVSAAEIIRDPAANAHLTREEQIAFANSEANLNEMPSSWNQSKGDKSMTDWLDNPNSKGQKPTETLDGLSDEKAQELREKNTVARTEYDRVKAKGEMRSVIDGRISQIKEGAKAVLFGLLASLLKNIMVKLLIWFKTGKRKLKEFLISIKNAIKEFFYNLRHNFKETLKTSSETFITTIVTEVSDKIKKFWLFLKQGFKSLKEAVDYIMAPENKNKPFDILVLEVGKILVAGLSVAGAIALNEVIENALLSVPFFALQIPLLGTVASIISTFFSAIVMGIIGALAIRLIDKFIANKQKELANKKIIEAGNHVLNVQSKQIELAKQRAAYAKEKARTTINNRHTKAAEFMKETITDVKNIGEQIAGNKRERQTNTTVEDDLQAIYNLLNKQN
ncbi:cation diffusion facilitator family transporter [Phascolarctobacterium succinatutens]|uniref:cation diffusion facilitator family transporter n=1 Tax=Phascolarctobacterium succinatutens TaxID=626940 RepID=UPI003AB4CC81